MRKRQFYVYVKAVTLTVVFFLALAGCNLQSGGSSGTGPLVYMTDTYNGRVYIYSIDDHEGNSSPLCTTSQNATGQIYFFNDMGFIAVGDDGMGNSPGLYYFDPNRTVPTCQKMNGPTSVSAQYMAYYNNTKAFVTDSNWGVWTRLWRFNPSDPGAGLTLIWEANSTQVLTEGYYFQGIALGADGKIYVADYNTFGNSRVHRFNPTTGALEATHTLTSGGATGIVAGTLGPDDVVFVAGSTEIESVRLSDGNLTDVAGTGGTLMAYHAGSGNMYVTGWNNTYKMDTTVGPPWNVTEIKDGADSFGGGSVIVDNNLVYISNSPFPAGVSKLYVIDASTAGHTSYSPVTVMQTGQDGATGLAVHDPAIDDE